MVIQSHTLSNTDALVLKGAICPFCGTSFQAGESIVRCPADSTPHHAECWRANQDRCTTLGCTGSGLVHLAAGDRQQWRVTLGSGPAAQMRDPDRNDFQELKHRNSSIGRQSQDASKRQPDSAGSETVSRSTTAPHMVAGPLSTGQTSIPYPATRQTSRTTRLLRPLFVGQRSRAAMATCFILGLASFYLGFHDLTAWTCLFAVLGLLLWVITVIVFSIQKTISKYRSDPAALRSHLSTSSINGGVTGLLDFDLDDYADDWLTGSRAILLIMLAVVLGAFSFGLAFGAITVWTLLFAPLSLLLWLGAGFVVAHFWRPFSL